MNINLLNMPRDIVGLLYPKICEACGSFLYKNESIICTKCIHDIPKTDFHKYPENSFSRMFWGKVKIEMAAAFFYFNKGGKYQNLLHKLKYSGNAHLGALLGRLFASELLSSPVANIDFIIPIPLHKNKLLKRGFNQSEIIAKGIAGILQKPMYPHLIKRTVDTDTQTRKNKYDRWLNTQNIFCTKKREPFKHKHVLLIDDVVTTGATMEACAKPILEIDGAKVSIAALAVA
jgi:ComF family protein